MADKTLTPVALIGTDKKVLDFMAPTFAKNKFQAKVCWLGGGYMPKRFEAAVVYAENDKELASMKNFLMRFITTPIVTFLGPEDIPADFKGQSRFDSGEFTSVCGHLAK